MIDHYSYQFSFQVTAAVQLLGVLVRLQPGVHGPGLQASGKQCAGSAEFGREMSLILETGSGAGCLSRHHVCACLLQASLYMLDSLTVSGLSQVCVCLLLRLLRYGWLFGMLDSPSACLLTPLLHGRPPDPCHADPPPDLQTLPR